MHEHAVPRGNRGDQVDLHGLLLPVRLAEREPALVVHPQHPHLDRDVTAGDAVLVVVAAHHSITLAFSSSSSCSYSAPIASSSLRVSSASCSSTLESAKPTWMRTQSPGAASSSRPTLMVRFTPATSTWARRLAPSTTSTIRPGMARHMVVDPLLPGTGCTRLSSTLQQPLQAPNLGRVFRLTSRAPSAPAPRSRRAGGSSSPPAEPGPAACRRNELASRSRGSRPPSGAG